MASTKNCTTLRLLHYPGISEDSIIKPGQIRCGEHTDYGSITLLFQDDMPGLEVNINVFLFCVIKGKTTESGLVRQGCYVLIFAFCDQRYSKYSTISSKEPQSIITIPKIFQGDLKSYEYFQRSPHYF